VQCTRMILTSRSTLSCLQAHCSPQDWMLQLFFVPVLRHFWHWLGVRPAHRKVMEKILSSGTSVVLCPGGVQECLVMEQNAEVVYLKNRRGFVRMAIQQGAGAQPLPSSS